MTKANVVPALAGLHHHKIPLNAEYRDIPCGLSVALGLPSGVSLSKASPSHGITVQALKGIFHFPLELPFSRWLKCEPNGLIFFFFSFLTSHIHSIMEPIDSNL